ncbi:MAG: cytochrome C oxidase subunit I [Burkholderiales bacterium]
MSANALSEEKRRRSARIHLIIIGAVAVFPILGSYLLYLFWQPSSFINHGELVATSPHLALAADDPVAPALNELKGKWILALAAPGDCAQACQQKLYYLRQIRLTQGKEMQRIERLWIVTGGSEPSGDLLKQHQGMKVVRAPQSDWVARLPVGGRPASEYIFILDPLGNLVLRYPPGFNPTGMKKDLSRLLRASRIG